MWSIEPTNCYERRFKQFMKSRERELKAALVNLNAYFQALREGTNPVNIRFGFLHNEGQGVYAVDQKGGGKGLSQIRLYVYPEVVNQVLWLLTIGDKNTQKRRDIQDCRDMVADIPRHGVNNNGRENGADQAGGEGEVR